MAHDAHDTPIKTPGQVITVVLLAFLVPIVGISMLAALITSERTIDPKSSAMADEAIAKRLRPVGEVVVVDAKAPKTEKTGEPAAVDAPQAPVEKPAPKTPGESDAKTAAAAKPEGGSSSAADAKPAAAQGKSVYDAGCVACHAGGLANAPKLGDKGLWTPRIQTGIDNLYASALKGKGAMPPKGGNASLSDAEVKAAVDFMVGQAK